MRISGVRISVFVSCFLAQSAVGQVNVVTQHNDIGRTGQNTNETILTPANVSGGNFGKLFSVSVDGQVYAQPLYLSQVAMPGSGTHNVVFTATMHDSVYAFDADSGAGLWQITLLDAAHGAAPGATTDPISDTGCTELAGTEFGITSTPVIDPVGGVIYVVGKTLENGYPVQRLHALSVKTGAEMPNSPVTLVASVRGTGSGSSNGVLNFDPKYENQRAGLLLLNGIVYIGFASHCDYGTWHGWILAYNGTTLKQTSVFTPTPNSLGSGIWMSGTGLAADVPAGSPYGRMFVATGNGTYDATSPYGTNTMDYGDDVLRLDLTNGVMTVTDAFTPFDTASLTANDMDLASGGVMLLPDQTLAGHTHQMLASGKTGNIYLVDRDSLGGYNTTTNNIIEYVSPNQIGGDFAAPAYWNGYVYYWGDEDTLKMFNFTNGLMNFWHSANSSESQSFPGSTPSISSNGTSNGIVWDIDSSGWVNGGNSNLLAHDATNVATTFYNSATNPIRDNPGLAVKMAVPTIANGKVYVGAYGQLSVYGLLIPDFSLASVPTSVSLQQGASSSSTVTVTPLAGFTGNVSLSASGLPTGLTVNFTAGSTSGTTVATFSATSATTAGTYPVMITGTSGALSHSAPLTVTVVSVSAPSFALKATPASVSLTQGQSTSSSISVVAANGFNNAVNLAVTGQPAGVTASFGTASGGVSMLTISALSTAVPQKFNLAVTGTSGTLTASTSILVTLAAQPTFSLIASNNSISVAEGRAGSVDVNVTPSAGFTGQVTFSAVGLPSGLTVAFSPPSSATGTTATFSAASNLPTGPNAIVITGVSGNASAAANVNVTITGPSLQPQSITFASIPTQTVGTSLALSASASSGLPVSFSSSTAGVCTVSGSTASILATGTCTITASQSGNSQYASATPVTQNFSTTQSITVTAAALSLAPGNGGVVAMTIAGLKTAPSTLGLGGIACVNLAGCQYNLGGNNGIFGFEFLGVTNNSALLVVYVTPSVRANNSGYSIPVTIGSSTVGTFKLVVP